MRVTWRINRIKFRLCVENRGVRFSVNRCFHRRRVRAARDNNEICSGQSRLWLAQTAGWKQVAAAKGIRGVDHHDVRVARELEMLKTIVEHKPVDATFCEF